MPITLSADKLTAAEALARLLAPGSRVALTTHVHPDGDGIGSEVGLAHLLRDQGLEVAIANPTVTPARFGFLFRDLGGVDRSREAVKALRAADIIVVLDISDLGRLGMLSRTVGELGVPVACIDHHVSPGNLPDGPRYLDPSASATGELICEVALANNWEITPPVARALYVALLTDTGGFRFSNTHPRTLRIAAELLETGVDPEDIYLEVYANAPPGRPRLLAETLQTLVVEDSLAWVTVPPGAIERHEATVDDLDGIVEFPRSIAGVRLALLFREISQDRVKVSLRSIGEVDVADFARPFGGGGHKHASGLSLSGTLPDVQARVLEAARRYLESVPRG
ncbi:MAG TPA: bifunctional oligoribonuclease/PAP phosphatase NrnA [Gemmatimonadales bacterium]|nr:bifunctional oligoribonuclease/PAP phosphatase NrnA [Gemmatimonadales bacterium]